MKFTREQIDHILDPVRVEVEIREYEKDPNGYIQRRFTELSVWDFEVWARINVKLTTKDGRRVPFVLNRVQRYLWRLTLECLTLGFPIRFIVVKARQMGVSTYLLAFFLWLTSLKENRNAIIISQDSESVQNFNSRFRSMIEEGHALLTPPIKTDRRDQVHFANPTFRGGGSGAKKEQQGTGVDSRAIFISCKRPGIGRSYTFQYAHLSETAFWGDMKPKVSIKEKMGALSHSIPLISGTCVFMETTPNGMNEMAEIWNEAVKGLNGYQPIFLSYASYDDYRLPLKAGEKFDLSASEEISGRSTRYGNEVAESKILREEIKKWYPTEYGRWGDEWLELEILARLNWRRHHIDNACGGDKKIFRREFPLTPQQGFEATSKNCFDLGSLQLMSQAVEAEGIQPLRFNYIHDPENDNAKEKFLQDEFGPLVVYKLPEEDRQYVIGADVGMGIQNTSDPSALVVLAVPDLEEVASFNQIITPDQFAELCYYLAKLYNVALLGLENNERGGYAANLRLHKDRQYPRLYYRFDHWDKKAAAQPGFVTKATNKSVLVSDLNALIREHEILFRTPLLIEQLEHYVDLDNGELGASAGFHDDLVSAAMISVHLSTKVHTFPAIVEQPGPGTAGHLLREMAKMHFPGQRERRIRPIVNTESGAS